MIEISQTNQTTEHSQAQLKSIDRNLSQIPNAAIGNTSAHQPKVYGIDFLIK